MADTTSILARIEEEGVQTVDFRFTDLSRTLAAHWFRRSQGIDERVLEEGVMFDGSAVPGWRDASESDMMIVPDLSTAPSSTRSAPSRR